MQKHFAPFPLVCLTREVQITANNMLSCIWFHKMCFIVLFPIGCWLNLFPPRHCYLLQWQWLCISPSRSWPSVARQTRTHSNKVLYNIIKHTVPWTHRPIKRNPAWSFQHSTNVSKFRHEPKWQANPMRVNNEWLGCLVCREAFIICLTTAAGALHIYSKCHSVKEVTVLRYHILSTVLKEPSNQWSCAHFLWYKFLT